MHHLDGHAAEKLANKGGVLVAIDGAAPEVGNLEEVVVQLLGRHAGRSLGIRHPVLLSGGSRLFWSHVRDERESNLDARFEVLVLADRTVGQLRVHAPKAPELALHARVLPQRRTQRERLGRLKVGVALLPGG